MLSQSLVTRILSRVCPRDVSYCVRHLASSTAIQFNRSPLLRPIPKPEQMIFGKYFTEHMITINWNHVNGWEAPVIEPIKSLALLPTAGCIQHAVGCFEGLKAYRDSGDGIRMFRPEMNMKRLSRSCIRLGLPDFDQSHLLDCISKWLQVEKRWIPSTPGYSLYIRPTAISLDSSMEFGECKNAMIFVIGSPVGPYYPEGFKAVLLLADPTSVRAVTGGCGDVKVGGNYGPSICSQLEAAKAGYTQVIWLSGEKHNVTEVGTMNLFCFWITPDGRKELRTAPLDGLSLPGITRDSILTLARQWGEFDVSEKPYSIFEMIDAVDQGRMIETFGAGTAAVVCPVKSFSFNDKLYKIPLDDRNPDAGIGPLTKRFSDTIQGIQYGRIPSPWSIKVSDS